MYVKTKQKADLLITLQMVQASGEKWKNLRTTFSPIFTSGKMKAMQVFINDACQRLVAAMDKIAEKGEPFETKGTLGKFSMDTIASCAFGIDANVHQTSEQSVFVKYANEIFRFRFTDMLKFMVAMLPFGTGLLRALNKSIQPKTETEFFYDVILKTLRHRQETKTRRNDLIDLMMDAVRGDIAQELDEEDQFDADAKMKTKSPKGSLTEDDIIATALVILVAGYETTATLLSFTCFELAKNMEVQDRLRQEVADIMDGGDSLNYESVQKMTYMDQVLSETLRLHVPLPILHRVALRDYTLPGTDITMPKGSEAWINPVGIHTDPKYYPNPNQFNPDNFSKESMANRHP